MLSKDGCRARLAQLKDRLDNPWDALIIHQPQHLLYLANFFPSPNSLNLHSSSFLLVERDGPTTLFTDNWLSAAEDAAVDEVHETTWYDCVSPARPRYHAVAVDLCERLRARGAERVAAELSVLPVEIARAVDSVFDIEGIIRSQREVKDADEIEAIRRGVRAAEAVHAGSREFLRAGETELEYYANLVARAIVAAESPLVMMCDLASGPRAAQGGGGPTDKVLEAGELVILDIFPYVEGYRGDITNTLVVGASPTPEQEDSFSLVESALDAGEGLLRPGMAVSQLYHEMDRALVDGGGSPLPHHGGHAIGLGHPEAPEIVPQSDRLLEEGMVITLEPGLYSLPTGGIRIEHNYLVTASGFERLSSHRLGLS